MRQRELEKRAQALAKEIRNHDAAWPECLGAGLLRKRWSVNCLAERVILPALRKLVEDAK